MSAMSVADHGRGAHENFFIADHGKCEFHLKLIMTAGGSNEMKDVKVTHNMLINEYYKGFCVDPRDLLHKLTQAFEKLRERDRKDKGKKRKEEADDEEHSSAHKDSYREDDDLTVLRYNMALLNMQCRYYTQAGSILEDLFANIEPIDDFIAIRVCFLHMDLCLIQRAPEQALHVMAHLEKPNVFLTVLRSERQPRVDTSRAGDDAAEGAEEDQAMDEDGEDRAAMAAMSTRPLETVSRAEEAVEGPLPSLAMGSLVKRHGRAPDTISRAEYKFYVLMYRARLAMLMKNSKSAKKDVKSAAELLQDIASAPLLTQHPHTTGAGPKAERLEGILKEALKNHFNALIVDYKAYLFFSKQSAPKAIKMIPHCQFNFAQSNPQRRSANDETDRRNANRRSTRGSAPPPTEDDAEDQPPTDFHPAGDEATAYQFFNNMGCVQLSLEKPGLAAWYFHQAMERLPPVPERGVKQASNYLTHKVGLTRPAVAATKHWTDRRAEIAYNAGLTLLMMEKPCSAFRAFEHCLSVYKNNPRYWLRVAECCIELHKRGLSGSASSGDYQAVEDEGAPSVSQIWTRDAASRTSLACGSQQSLVWSIQGVGPWRRWLLTTSRKPAVGIPVVEGDNPGGKGSGKSSKATIPVVATEASDGPGPRDADGLPVHLRGDGALFYAISCLRNILIQTAPQLPDTNAVNTESAAAAAAAEPSAADGASARGGEANANSTAAGSDKPESKAREVVESEASLLEDTALVKMAYVGLCLNDNAIALRHSRKLLEKNGLLPQDGEGEEPRRSWTFQTSNFLHNCTFGTDPSEKNQPTVKYPASAGCVMLASMYATEALVAMGKQAEAKALLGTFVKESSTGGVMPKASDAQDKACKELEKTICAHLVGSANNPEAHDNVDEKMRNACGGMHPGNHVGGLTSPSWVMHGAGGSSAVQAARSRAGGRAESEDRGNAKESGHVAFVSYPPAEFPRLGDAQCALLTNMASLQAQEGNLNAAEKSCEKALQAQPRALAPLRTLIYVYLRKGQHEQALARMKQSRSQ